MWQPPKKKQEPNVPMESCWNVLFWMPCKHFAGAKKSWESKQIMVQDSFVLFWQKKQNTEFCFDCGGFANAELQLSWDTDPPFLG